MTAVSSGGVGGVCAGGGVGETGVWLPGELYEGGGGEGGGGGGGGGGVVEEIPGAGGVGPSARSVLAKKGDGGMTCGRGWYGESTAGTTSGDASGVAALPIKELGGVSQAFAGN